MTQELIKGAEVIASISSCSDTTNFLIFSKGDERVCHVEARTRKESTFYRAFVSLFQAENQFTERIQPKFSTTSLMNQWAKKIH
jgi:hypothetical protein